MGFKLPFTLTSNQSKMLCWS